MTITRLTAHAVTDAIVHHGEGPCWSPSWGGLRFVDAEAGALVTLTADGPVRMEIGRDLAAFVRPRAGGVYVVGTRAGVALADDANSPVTREITLQTDTGLQTNDGATTPDGWLLAGSMAADESPTGALHLIDPSLGSRVVFDGVAISNGIGFSPDGARMYYVDSGTGRIDVLEGSGHAYSGRRPFVTIPETAGAPDGLCVDASGTVWVALWGGNAVHAYDTQGELVAVVAVDAHQVSACTFGDDDLGTLYITTSRQGLRPDEDPAAGSLFAVRPGAVGMPVVPFAG